MSAMRRVTKERAACVCNLVTQSRIKRKMGILGFVIVSKISLAQKTDVICFFSFLGPGLLTYMA